MGWRKLTIQDGDLARCCAAEGPIICEASLEACFDAAASSLAVRQWPTVSRAAADWADSVLGSRVRACGVSHGVRLCSHRCAWDAGRRFLSCGG